MNVLYDRGFSMTTDGSGAVAGRERYQVLEEGRSPMRSFLKRERRPTASPSSDTMSGGVPTLLAKMLILFIAEGGGR